MKQNSHYLPAVNRFPNPFFEHKRFYHTKSKKVAYSMIKNFLKTHSDYFKTVISIYHLVSILAFMILNAFRDTVSIISLVALFIGEILVFYFLYIMSSNDSDS